MAVNFQKTIPVLRIFSVEKAEEFYVAFLGFSEEMKRFLESPRNRNHRKQRVGTKT